MFENLNNTIAKTIELPHCFLDLFRWQIKAELLKINVEPNGRFDSTSDASTGGSEPSAKVIIVQMLDSIFLPNKDISELNIYFCTEVNRASVALTMKHTASINETSRSSDEYKNCRSWSTIALSRSMPLVSPKPGVSMMFRT